MAGPNEKHGRGLKSPPPSVIAAPPAAPVEPVSPVAAAEPVQPPASFALDVSKAGDLGQAREALSELAKAASAAPAVAPTPAPPPSYVATLRLYVGGQKGHVEPGEPYKPESDTERDRLLSQGAIREA